MIVSLLAIGLCIPTQSIAMGPIFAGPHVATWDAVPLDQSVYIYWRTQGATSWSDQNRSPKISGTTYDLADFKLPVGNYEITATAVDAAGSESDPANPVPFPLFIPACPSNLKLNLPSQ